MFYAQINDAGLCVAVTQTAAPSDLPSMIQIDALDLSYLGRTWAEGVWS